MKIRLILSIFWIGLPILLEAQSVTIQWQPNSEEDLASYRIYYGQRHRYYTHWFNTGNVTSYTFESFPDTGQIYMALTAIDTTGNESLYSKEVTFYVLPDYLRGEGFDLLPNHPNPFNPVTVIPYRIREQTHVKMVIYDVLGREVEVLVDQEKKPGQYHARWDGLHSQGGELANGIYICRLIVGDFYQSRKLMYLK